LVLQVLFSLEITSMERLNELFPSLERRAKDKDAAILSVSRQRPGNPFFVLSQLIIGVPLYIIVTLPLGLVALIHRIFCFTGKRQRDDDVCTEDIRRITNEQKKFSKLEERTYDVVVIGATGLTGSALAQYLASYHPSVKVALAGRTKSKLEAVKASLGAPATNFGIIVANSADLGSLFEMCRQTRVVATTVGPFKRFGTKLVHACAHSGTHYADITGEPDWVSHMSKLYDGVAQRTGAAIVSCCGVDSVPSDVGSFLAVQRLREEHSECTVHSIEAVMTKFSGGAPAGTIETAAGMMDGTDVLQKPPLDFKPSEKIRTSSTRVVGLNSPLVRSSIFKQWTIPFFMAQTNSSTVRRTNARLCYAPNLTYTERWGFPDLSAALGMLVGFIMALPYIALPLLRSFSRAVGAVPKPDAGAKAVTVESCVRGACCMLVSAQGRNAQGDIVSKNIRFAGIGDVGVAHTAICHGEISVLLAKRKSGLVGAGMTPVAALGSTLADALVNTGFIFIDDVPAKCLRS